MKETNRRDRKCVAQIRYIANKLGHQEVDIDVFRGEHITYHYNIEHRCLIIKRGNKRYIRHRYNDFEMAITQQDYKEILPRKRDIME